MLTTEKQYHEVVIEYEILDYLLHEAKEARKKLASVSEKLGADTITHLIEVWRDSRAHDLYEADQDREQAAKEDALKHRSERGT